MTLSLSNSFFFHDSVKFLSYTKEKQPLCGGAAQVLTGVLNLAMSCSLKGLIFISDALKCLVAELGKLIYIKR